MGMEATHEKKAYTSGKGADTLGERWCTQLAFEPEQPSKICHSLPLRKRAVGVDILYPTKIIVGMPKLIIKYNHA